MSGDPPQIVHKTTTVAAGLPGLDCGQYDMMAVGLVASDERKKSVAFTEPIFWSQNVIVVPPGSTHVGTIFEEHPGVLKVVLTSAQDQPGAEAIDKNLTKFVDAYNKELTGLANDGTRSRSRRPASSPSPSDVDCQADQADGRGAAVSPYSSCQFHHSYGGVCG